MSNINGSPYHYFYNNRKRVSNRQHLENICEKYNYDYKKCKIFIKPIRKYLTENEIKNIIIKNIGG